PQLCGDHPLCHSFPTRRSSDLHTPDVFFGAAVMRRHLSPVTFALGLREIIDGQLPRADATTEHQCAIAIEGDNVIILLHLNGNGDRKSTRLNSSHLGISYAVFC